MPRWNKRKIKNRKKNQEPSDRVARRPRRSQEARTLQNPTIDSVQIDWPHKIQKTPMLGITKLASCLIEAKHQSEETRENWGRISRGSKNGGEEMEPWRIMHKTWNGRFDRQCRVGLLDRRDLATSPCSPSSGCRRPPTRSSNPWPPPAA